MDDDPLGEALTVLRAADALRRSLPAGSRDRETIEAHILVLDREIHTLVTAEPNGDDANQLRCVAGHAVPDRADRGGLGRTLTTALRLAAPKPRRHH